MIVSQWRVESARERFISALLTVKETGFFFTINRMTDSLSVFYCCKPKSARTLGTRLALVWHHSSTRENSLRFRDGQRLDNNKNNNNNTKTKDMSRKNNQSFYPVF